LIELRLRHWSTRVIQRTRKGFLLLRRDRPAEPLLKCRVDPIERLIGIYLSWPRLLRLSRLSWGLGLAGLSWLATHTAVVLLNQLQRTIHEILRDRTTRIPKRLLERVLLLRRHGAAEPRLKRGLYLRDRLIWIKRLTRLRRSRWLSWRLPRRLLWWLMPWRRLLGGELPRHACWCLLLLILRLKLRCLL